ncbi:hypothetical protein BDQ94DRAFT_152047 [Aspergillus welwitschiae]|uniref:Uncharacterized protein n=1 Tax=Aspergillus welwitschiae TaxID=1341132 RepID=A0A3F3PNF9_9EURO|nr:hypothetical protein BDQ94DRAFT_152047 [Aspergillus welwitschiae]RDH28475.1 hypothetical protein BDQ94DRAFT_152047 [Aspergillus welwitschiae]
MDKIKEVRLLSPSPPPVGGVASKLPGTAHAPPPHASFTSPTASLIHHDPSIIITRRRNV